MNIIDMRTLLLNQGIIYTLCTGVIFLLWLQNRQRFSGTGLWLVNFFMQMASIGLIILRGTAPNWASIILGGYTLPIGGTILFYIGLEHFVEKRSRQLHNFVLLLLGTSIHAYFSFIQINLAARNINFSLGMSLISIQISWLMLRKVSSKIRPITRWIGYIFIAFALTSFARIAVNTFFPIDNDFLASTVSPDAILLLVYQILFFTVTFSLFLMLNQRLCFELQNQQAALKQSEIRYRKLIERSPNALFVFHETKISFVNSAAVALLGATSTEDLIGRSVFEFIHPDYVDTVRKRIANALSKEKTVPLLEEKFLRLDGTAIDVEVTTSPLEYQGRTVLQTVARDITERKRTETQLHVYQKQLEDQNLELRKLSLAIEQSGNIVIITDKDGNIQYANPRFEKSSGYKQSEVIGKNPRILQSGQQDTDFYQDLWNTITKGQIWRGEFHNRHKNGSLYWESAAIAPVHNDAGEITNFIAIKDEITERKRLEAELEKLATTDSLTNTFNRRQLTEIVNNELERAYRYEHFTSIIMLDIDFFKKINDTYGHAAGDYVLRKIAESLLTGLRKVDSLGRYGGDEFVIVLPETNRFKAKQIAERLCTQVAKQEIIYEGHRLPVSISLGVVYIASQAEKYLLNFDAIIKLADKALYDAKAEGRNRVKVL